MLAYPVHSSQADSVYPLQHSRIAGSYNNYDPGDSSSIFPDRNRIHGKYGSDIIMRMDMHYICSLSGHAYPWFTSFMFWQQISCISKNVQRCNNLFLQIVKKNSFVWLWISRRFLAYWFFRNSSGRFKLRSIKWLFQVNRIANSKFIKSVITQKSVELLLLRL